MMESQETRLVKTEETVLLAKNSEEIITLNISNIASAGETARAAITGKKGEFRSSAKRQYRISKRLSYTTITN